MAYLRLLRPSDLRTIQNAYAQLFGLPAPSRRALEEALGSTRWLSIAAVSPDPDSPSREDYMGGFCLSAVATVEAFTSDMGYYPEGAPSSPSAGTGGPVGVQATGLEAVGLPQAERAVNICLLGVLPTYRRRGLARLMLKQVLDSARTASACAVFLHVRPCNAAALALYRSFGFVPTALIPGYYDVPLPPAPEANGTAKADDPAAPPLPAGGDAVLLVLPLTPVAAAAVAAAAEAAAHRVAAAAAAERALAQAQSPSTAPAAAGAAAAAATPSGQAGSRWIGRPAAATTAAAASAASASATSTSGGGGGGGPGLFGILAAAAAGAAEGLSVLLPGRTRGGGSGADDANGRRLSVGGEELLEERGPDGEVYLRGPTDGGEEAAAAAAAAAQEEMEVAATTAAVLAARAAAAAEDSVSVAAGAAAEVAGSGSAGPTGRACLGHAGSGRRRSGPGLGLGVGLGLAGPRRGLEAGPVGAPLGAGGGLRRQGTGVVALRGGAGVTATRGRVAAAVVAVAAARGQAVAAAPSRRLVLGR
ncbi:hypothetical protein HYH03_013760 [Edaphochlamys debaryana]|uniref:N-acetyltransferase domain-containing protein n=1 Tax=Edaphochlamys debaryana TaxID=47281 RepID=A0A835XPE6_9CHLO|nr:hypothetical protein HYH03_013760 [Edaphochlamys debaryana]|eukprot:KAG2487621.1 hypothetical protein HYH03_013760 [Edaphochlamys debaryana]